MRPDGLLSRLDAEFLEAQPDEWVRKLYETLGEHSGLRDRWRRVPLVRLSDGSHVRPADGERPAAFLPGPTPAELPTVRAAVCDSPAAGRFLRELGLAPPDPVDHVLRAVVPRYRGRSPDPAPEEYAADFEALVEAHGSSQRAARRRLERELRGVAFVPAVDLGTGEASFATAEAICFASGPQRELFGGVPGVRVVDDGRAVLRGEAAGALLRAAGVRGLLEPAREVAPLSAADQREVREVLTGAARETGVTRIEDWTLLGLDALLPAVARMPAPERRRRAALLARELEGLVDLNDLAVRSGKYEWEPAGGAPRTGQIPARWMRRLNRSDWAPDARPVVSIRSPEAGARRKPDELDPAAAELLRRRGVRTVEAVRELLSRPAAPASGTDSGAHHVASSPARGPAVEAIPDSGEGRHFQTPDQRRRRLDVENEAIRVIQESEPEWIRAPQENAGFDLFQRDEGGATVRWCEVKALRGTLEARPARLTSTQARFALERGEAYWLYIVEKLGSANPGILRIQDPVGRAGRFAFGPEWRAFAAKTPPPG